MTEQANDPYIKEAVNIFGKRGFVYSLVRNEVLVKQTGIDGALQNFFVPPSLHAGIQCLKQYPVFAGYPCER